MKLRKLFSLYIVDCFDCVRYVGITSDVVHRVIDHFARGGGSITTKNHQPYNFTVVAELLSEEQAKKAETALVELLRAAGQEVYGGGYVEDRKRDTQSSVRKAEESVGAEASDYKMLT